MVCIYGKVRSVAIGREGEKERKVAAAQNMNEKIMSE